MVAFRDVVKPFKGFRLHFMAFCLRTYSKIHASIIFGVKVTDIHKDYDYSYYLGPNYRETQKKYTHPSTVIANHSSGHDQFIITRYVAPRYIASSFANIPVLGYLFRCVQTTFINTVSDIQEEKDKAKKIIQTIQ